jgi:hypothetical protein
VQRPSVLLPSAVLVGHTPKRWEEWAIGTVRTAEMALAGDFEAIAKTLPLGSVGYENKTNEKGKRLIWLDSAVLARLRSLRGPGESYSDVILRLAGEGESRADS